uniref:Uncharacterized protein n=1 Tax=Meloidogyne enterolobii TaxID=390850 RepID=A0A6V7TXM0_MELEN|nr:unnamed protein product [Meloidogyne enterolobii]
MSAPIKTSIIGAMKGLARLKTVSNFEENISERDSVQEQAIKLESEIQEVIAEYEHDQTKRQHRPPFRLNFQTKKPPTNNLKPDYTYATITQNRRPIKPKIMKAKGSIQDYSYYC